MAGEPDPAGIPAPEPTGPEALDLTGLPPLEYPHSPDREAAEAAARRRRTRVRIEAAGAGMVVLIGLGAAALLHSAGIAILTVLAAVVMAAYELLVVSLE
ncbi:MAG TPA: hypothetical protein VG245_04930 [Candidatus Dormibacteraeota bacterium]|jgi:hypothetical protein|nr:hypothetical protein [Candidatus Dormibacteraeota bacterium]